MFLIILHQLIVYVVSKHIFVSKTKLNIEKIDFSVPAPTIWNQLPIRIKSSETIHTFRKQMKTYLFEIAFFTITFRLFHIRMTTCASPRV